MARIYVIERKVARICVIHLLAKKTDNDNSNTINLWKMSMVKRCPGQCLWFWRWRSGFDPRLQLTFSIRPMESNSGPNLCHWKEGGLNLCHSFICGSDCFSQLKYNKCINWNKSRMDYWLECRGMTLSLWVRLPSQVSLFPSFQWTVKVAQISVIDLKIFSKLMQFLF